MSANEIQIGGEHYKSTFQHWDFVRYLNLGYFPAQITRYVQRWRKKNGLEDIDKSLHYIDKFIEEEGKRHTEHLTLLDEFMKTHKLQEHERIVFNMLVNYQLGDIDRLHEARDAIKELRGIISGQPVDPEFKDQGDEWRR